MNFRVLSVRHVRSGAIAVSAVAACLAGGPAIAGAADRPADPGSFASVFGAAQPGDTVLLASGNYGSFQGAMKPGMVTVRAQPGATASMQVNFRPAANITLDGLTINGLLIGGPQTKNITVRNSSFPASQATLRTGELSNANVLLDHNTHVGYNAGSGGGEGRVFLPEKTSQPSGVTIQYSLFEGGNSDGIQNGGRGVRILGNEFRGIRQIDGASGVHADSIQLYGSAQTEIRGNWFHDVAVGIMCADRCDHETVEDNVFAGNGSPYGVTWLSDAGSVVRHNTFLDYGTCDYGQPCGVLYLGNKSADPVSSGTVVKDNILTRVCVCDGSTRGTADEGYNLYTQGSGSSPGDLKGRPAYVGGANPGSFAGFQLAAGSLGKSSASDGADRGARVLDWPRVGGNAAPPASPAAGGGGGGNARSGSRRLVAAYAFDERSGRRVQDASGHGRWGVIHGARRVKGRSGRALAFDGRGDFVSIGDARALDLHKRMTLEAWVRPRGQLSRRPVIAKKFGRRVAYGLYAGDHRGRPAASASKRVVRARNRLRRNRWSHLAVTFNGRQVRLFVNGKQVRHQPRRRALRASHGQLRIGGGVAGPSFKGLIDNVRVYRRALGRQAIKRDMRAAI